MRTSTTTAMIVVVVTLLGAALVAGASAAAAGATTTTTTTTTATATATATPNHHRHLSWGEGEAWVGQAQALNDGLVEAKETVVEALNEMKTTFSMALQAKGDVLSALQNATAMAADDTVATALGGQTALGAIGQTLLQGRNLFQRRAAAGAGAAMSQTLEQPVGVVGAFGEGRALGSGVLPAGAGFGAVVPTVAGNTAPPVVVGGTQQQWQNDQVKDAAIAGLANALAEQSQALALQPGVAVVDEGGAFVDGGGGFVDGGAAAPGFVDGSGGFVSGAFVDPGFGAAAEPVGAPSATTTAVVSATATPTPPSAAEQRFFQGVAAALDRALRAVPLVRGSASSSAAAPVVATTPTVAFPPQVLSQQGELVGSLLPVWVGGGGEVEAVVGVPVPAGAIVRPRVIEVPEGGGGGAGGGGTGSGGPINARTSAPVSIDVPVSVDTPIRQSNVADEGKAWGWLGRRLLMRAA